MKKSLEKKFCKDCSVKLTEENTNDYDILVAQYICKSCHTKRAQKRYEKKKPLIRAQQRIYDLSNKLKVIQAYGGKCVCCGEENIEFLTIDHINNDGVEDRKNNGNKSGGKLYRWLIKNEFPQGKYQVLCFNCNCSKGFFGYCPHNKPDVIIRVSRK